MSNADSTATVQNNVFKLPTMVGGDFTMEDLAEDMEGLQIEFPKIKIPSGGGLAFEVPQADSDEPEITQKLRGVIVAQHKMFAYWPDGSDEEDKAPPACSSFDGKNGIGNPGTECINCPHNQWGTAETGNGKACKNGIAIYLLREDTLLPVQITLPPTSMKPFTSFASTFKARMRATYGSFIEIGLAKKTNSGGKDYSVATFKLLRDFGGQELKDVMEYAKGMKEQIKNLNEQRAVSHLDANNNEQSYYDDIDNNKPLPPGYLEEDEGELPWDEAQ